MLINTKTHKRHERYLWKEERWWIALFLRLRGCHSCLACYRLLYTCLLNAVHGNCLSTQAAAFNRAGRVWLCPHLRPLHSRGHTPRSSSTRGFRAPLHKYQVNVPQVKVFSGRPRYPNLVRGLEDKGASLVTQTVKKSICSAGDLSSIPEWRRAPGRGRRNPLQYSCLGNPMDRRAWWATDHGVTKVGHNCEQY